MALFFSPLKKALFGRLSSITYTVILLYLFLPGVVINIRLFADTVFGAYDLSYKINLTLSLLLGSLVRFTTTELLFIVLIAILLGINFSLLLDSIQRLRHAKRLTVSVGGTGLIALAASGCASCGISLLSVLGISTALLPVHGLPLYILSCGLLVLSLCVTLQTHRKACEINGRENT